MERHPALTPREVAALYLAEEAYEDIDRRYGANGLTPKDYHNVRHARDVVSASVAIIGKAIIAGRMKHQDLPLAIIAGSYHDIEYNLGSGENEKASAAVAVERMRKSGQFSKEDTQRVSMAIIATTVTVENGSLRQSAGDDPLAQALADADLANLGYETEQFLSRSNGLLAENGQTEAARDRFLTLQKDLLTHHVFYTAEAAELFPNQAHNLAYTERSLASL